MRDASSILSALDGVGAALTEGDGREHVYRAVDSALQTLIGHKLFTLLLLLPGGQEVQRFWSSNEQAYPLTGRKVIGSTPWGELVLAGRQSYLGRDAAAIRWAFADHELIASLGLASVINIPVVLHRNVLGTLNVLDAEGSYDDDAVATACRFAPYLISAFRDEREAAATP